MSQRDERQDGCHRGQQYRSGPLYRGFDHRMKRIQPFLFVLRRVFSLLALFVQHRKESAGGVL
ncbi:hypothetical protein C4J95_2674 [Pseudomonas orientalis]|nr:hypothetical protein C4J95_2674 [Pseudomonas orientalis]